MGKIDCYCILIGEHLSPTFIKQELDGILLRSSTEPGEKTQYGRWKDTPAPYGSCIITTPQEIENAEKLNWLTGFLLTNRDKLTALGMENFEITLIWSGIQGNIELSNKEIKQLSLLNKGLAIDYIQES